MYDKVGEKIIKKKTHSGEISCKVVVNEDNTYGGYDGVIVNYDA